MDRVKTQLAEYIRPAILLALVFGFLYVWPGVYRYRYLGGNTAILWRVDTLTGQAAFRTTNTDKWETE